MSSGNVRRVSREDIQLVQNLIERCLQLYMSQKEVVDTLLKQAKIEPGFTELVWQKLEEENPEFFHLYYLRLMLKQQILQFNRLLEQQVELMHVSPTAVSSLPASNGSHIPGVASIPSSNGSHMPSDSLLPTSNWSHSHIPTISQNPACYTAERAQTAAGLKLGNMQHPVDSSLSNSVNNGGLSLHTRMHAAIDMSAPGNRINGRPSMISAQTPNMGPIQGTNGGLFKSEHGYSGCPPYMFGTEGNVLDARPTIAGASVTPLPNVESNSQPPNVEVLNQDTSSFGFLGLIPRNLSLSDLAAHFSMSSDILESYPRSPFMAADYDNFLDSGELDNHMLDTISEGLSYDDFGNE